MEAFFEHFEQLNDQHKVDILLQLCNTLTPVNQGIICEHLKTISKIDFITRLPVELSRQIITNLDAKSICSCARVKKNWEIIANSDEVWQKLCLQHVKKECVKCGWSLPCLDNIMDTNWKDFYKRRMKVEKNWRKGVYSCSYLQTSISGQEDGITALYFNEMYLITGGWDTFIYIWDIKSRKLLQKLSGHSGCVRGLKFDNDKLMSVSMDKSLKIWSISEGKLMRSFDNAHNEGITCIDFDWPIVATGSNDHSIKIWDFSTGESSQIIAHEDWVNRVLLYHKESVISCSDDNTVKLWDIASKSCLKTFQHDAQVQGLSMMSSKHYTNSKYPEFIISGDLEGIITLWNVKNNSQIEFFGNKSGIWTISINPQRIIAGTVDGSIKIWNLSGELKLVLNKHESDVKCIQMDETKIISGSEDNSILLWNFDI